MNLKSVMRKILASMVVLYMVGCNFAFAGIGLKRIIAEETKIPKILIDQNIQKYVQYNNQNNKGAAIQTGVNIKEDANSELYLPVENMNLEISVPKVNNQLPERVVISKSNTELTTGGENKEISQNYNKDTGLLTIAYKNKDNYTTYKENTKDEFEIIYIYSELAYLDNIESNLVQNCFVRVNYKSENEILHTENKNVLREKEKENKGEIIDYSSVSMVEDVYKGYMYSNESNNTNYNTNYKTLSELRILNKDIVDKIDIGLEKSSFILDNNKELQTDFVNYRSTKITEKEFNKMFGKDGVVEFYLGKIKYAAIKYSEADKNGKRNYVTEYYTQQKQNIQAGIVEYPEQTVNVKIETTKPIIEGNIIFENEKQIIAKNNYGKKVNELKYIKEVSSIISSKVEGENNIQVVNKQNSGNIVLNEPVTQMNLELSNNRLSTLSTNNITATIKFNDTNSSCKLFKEGRIEISLPKNIVSAKITNVKSLYTNGLKVINASIEKGKIILDVKGNQTTYDITNASGGVNIVIDLEIDISYLTASHKETLKMSYNENILYKDVDIVSKDGLLLLSKINNLTKNDNQISIINSNKNISIDKYSNNQLENIEFNIVNNNENKLTDISILGTFGYNDEKLKSTFNTIIQQPIISNKGEIKYSVDGKNWTNDFISNAKFFAIVLKNNELDKKDSLQVSLKAIIPENLNYNASSYIKYEVNFSNNNIKQRETSIIGFETEKIDVNINSTNSSKAVVLLDGIIGKEKIDEKTKINEGQFIKYRYVIKNVSNENLENLNLVISPNNIKFYEKDVKEKNQNMDVYSTRYYVSNNETPRMLNELNLKPGEIYVGEIQAYVKLGVDTAGLKLEILDSNNKIAQKEYSNKVEKADISLETKYEYNEEEKVYSNATLPYVIVINNISDKVLKNVNIRCLLPNELDYDVNNLDELILGDSKEYFDSISKKGQALNWTINKLEVGETREIYVTTSTKDIGNNISSKDVSIFSECTCGNKKYVSNELVKTINQSKSNINVDYKASVEGDSLLENGDTINYTFTLENNGKFDVKSISFESELDLGFNFEELKIRNKEGKVLYKSNEENSLEDVELKSNETKIIEYRVKYNSDEADINKDNINNKMFIETGYAEGFTYDEQYKINKQNNYKVNDDIQNSEMNAEENSFNNNESNNVRKAKEENKNSDSFTVSGLTWLDQNKNGQRDDEEELLKSVKIYLINKKTGDKVTTDTSDNGEYKFTDIKSGKYLIASNIDTDLYNVTVYKKEGVNNSLNSDVLMNNIKLDGEIRKLAITDDIEVKSDIDNIDVGLVKKEKFDLSLRKEISKIILINDKGTKIEEYKNKDKVKLKIPSRYADNTNMIITYKYLITNDGDIEGYADKLVDYLPEGLIFTSEMNKEWYKDSKGKVYTTCLSGVEIKPGETKEVELILTKEGIKKYFEKYEHDAEIDKESNIQAIEELTHAKENNKSSSELVITEDNNYIYFAITMGSIILISIGAYFVNKRIEKEKYSLNGGK